MENTTPSRVRLPQAYIIKVSWPIEAITVASTKIYQYFYVFISFYPSSLFQPPIIFSLRPDGGLRRSKWPCRPRTTLRRASPDGVPPGGAIQSDWCELVHYTGSDIQTATMHGRTAHLCTPTVKLPSGSVQSPTTVRQWSNHQTRSVSPPVLGTEALGPISGTHGCVRVTAVKLSASTNCYRKVIPSCFTISILLLFSNQSRPTDKRIL
jgi:hypothetical protein